MARLLSQLSLAHWLLDKIYHAAFKLCVIMVTYTACCNMQSSPAHCLLEYPDSMRVLDLLNATVREEVLRSSKTPDALYAADVAIDYFV